MRKQRRDQTAAAQAGRKVDAGFAVEEDGVVEHDAAAGRGG
jgi:hypothetical protein